MAFSLAEEPRKVEGEKERKRGGREEETRRKNQERETGEGRSLM